ncbi:hypothetical protein B296_00011090 [Ensete ventricosum]|uniref:Uncharacterized protein n=1 Tax=Ensete ventricosum TaxID=4639 RepID=A0A427B9V8_ENSVE|nr:hypothetical protein B296_00011090 [Ensete ventricosum]
MLPPLRTRQSPLPQAVIAVAALGDHYLANAVTSIRSRRLLWRVATAYARYSNADPIVIPSGATQLLPTMEHVINRDRHPQ